MGLFVHGLFALFDIVGHSAETVNAILRTAKDGSTVDSYQFWLADTVDYASAIHKKGNGMGQEGTPATIQPDFKSPFAGKSVDECAKWLRAKPHDIDLDSNFFAVLDNEAPTKVVLVKIGDKNLKGDQVSCMLEDAEVSSLYLAGMEYGTWEEIAEQRKGGGGDEVNV